MGIKNKALVTLMIVSLGELMADLQKKKVQRETSFASECVLQLIRTYYNMAHKLSVRMSNEKKQEWSNMIQRLDVPVIINADEVPQIRGLDTRTPADVVLIIEDQYDPIEGLNRILWTADSQFIFIIQDSFDATGKMVSLFNQFLSNNAVNVMALIEHETYVTMYTYLPVTNCHASVDSPIVIDVCFSGRFQKTVIEKITGMQRLPNLRGCHINVTVVDIPPAMMVPNKKNKDGSSDVYGTEATLVREMAKVMNFTPRFAVAEDGGAWGWIEPMPNGAVGEVFTGHSTLAVGSIAATMERIEYLDMSISTSPVLKCLTWAVPTGMGKRKPTWIYILVNEFPGVVWSSILVAYFVATITIRVVVKFSKIDVKLLHDHVHTFMYMFSSALGVPVKIPQGPSSRTLFTAWIWFSFILVTAYQSSMGSKLTVPPVLPDINTYTDLIESDLLLTGLENTFKDTGIIYEEHIQDLKTIAKRLKPADYHAHEAVRRIVEDKNIAYIQDAATFLYHALFIPHAKGQVHVMTQCPLVYYPKVVLKKRSPLTKRVDQIIYRLFESGVLAKWLSEYSYDKPPVQPKVVRLSLSYLIGPFFILGVGYTLSIVAFLGELAFKG